jgi:hypothetical protein
LSKTQLSTSSNVESGCTPQAAFPGRTQQQEKINLFILNFFCFIGGFAFVLLRSAFSVQLSALFLIDRVRKLQFARIGAMIFP